MGDLEQRVEALEQVLAGLTAPSTPSAGAELGSYPDLWLLQELRNRYPAAEVIFGGTADTASGPVSWQLSLIHI